MDAQRRASTSPDPPLPIVVWVAAPADLTDEDMSAWQRELAKPLSGVVCLASWLLATAIFFGLVALLGGPTQADAVESLYGTWAIAHGSLACSYPPARSIASSFLIFYQPHPAVPPLWPLVSGGLSALTGIGHTVPFPSQHALGASCGNGYLEMYRWSITSIAILPTVGLGYTGWFVLLAGVIALLRATGRGRCVWEAFGVVFVALVPVVWMPLLDEYHPQDLVALGLGLAGIACALRGRWVWAGVLVGLAITSQQFALLILAPLLVVAPGRERWKLLGSSAVPVVLVSAPFLLATSGRALHAVVVGTGDSGTRGGTFLWELISHSSALDVSSRALPILAAITLAWWALRRLGPRALDPIPLLSLIATSLSMRLVFEEGLYGYKFMALAVMLIILGIVRGSIRGRLVAWLALVTLVFNPIPTGLDINARTWANHVAAALPVIFMAIVLVLILRDALHRRVSWYLVAWFVIAACAFLRWPLWVPNALHAPLPLWFWQLVLLIPGVVMAASPLVKSISGGTRPRSWATFLHT